MNDNSNSKSGSECDDDVSPASVKSKQIIGRKFQLNRCIRPSLGRFGWLWKTSKSQNGNDIEPTHQVPADMDDGYEDILKLVAADGRAPGHATDAQKGNRNIVLAAVKNYGGAIAYIDTPMWNDVETTMAAAKSDPLSLRYAPRSFHCKINIDDPDIIRSVVERDGNLLHAASHRLRGDRDTVLSAIKNNSSAIRYASEALRDDAEFVRAAIEVSSPEQWEDILKYASSRVRSDKTTVLMALSKPPCEFGSFRDDPYSYIDVELLDDKEVAKSFIRHGKLEHLPHEMKKKELCLEAISLNLWHLKVAPFDLCDNKQVVHAAVSRNGHVLQHASPALRNDRDIVEAAVRNAAFAVEFASHHLRADRSIITLAVQKEGEALEYASDALKGDREIVNLAIAECPLALVFASRELKNDEAIVALAVATSGITLEFASDRLQNNAEIVSIAVTENGNALKYASSRLQSNEQIALLAIQQNSRAYQFTDITLKDDPDIVAAAASYIVENIYDSDFSSNIGPELCTRLCRLNEALEKESDLPSSEDTINDGVWEAFAENNWRFSVYETIWLLGNQGLPYDMKKSIVEYAGLGEKICLANELKALAFLYRRFATVGWNWNDIPLRGQRIGQL